jgi:hypothetical protein
MTLVSCISVVRDALSSVNRLALLLVIHVSLIMDVNVNDISNTTLTKRHCSTQEYCNLRRTLVE